MYNYINTIPYGTGGTIGHYIYVIIYFSHVSLSTRVFYMHTSSQWRTSCSRCYNHSELVKYWNLWMWTLYSQTRQMCGVRVWYDTWNMTCTCNINVSLVLRYYSSILDINIKAIIVTDAYSCHRQQYHTSCCNYSFDLTGRKKPKPKRKLGTIFNFWNVVCLVYQLII